MSNLSRPIVFIVILVVGIAGGYWITTEFFAQPATGEDKPAVDVAQNEADAGMSSSADTEEVIAPEPIAAETPPPDSADQSVVAQDAETTAPGTEVTQAAEVDAAGAAADEAADAAAIAADAAAEAVQATEDEAGSTGSAAAEEAEAAAEEAIAAANRAADAAAQAEDSGSAGSVDEAEVAAQEAVEAADTATQIESALTPEGYDPAQVNNLIESSEMPAPQQETLKRLLEDAGDNPDMLREALDKIRTDMQNN